MLSLVIYESLFVFFWTVFQPRQLFFLAASAARIGSFTAAVGISKSTTAAEQQDNDPAAIVSTKTAKCIATAIAATTAAEQQDNDPAAVSTKTIVTTHIQSS